MMITGEIPLPLLSRERLIAEGVSEEADYETGVVAIAFVVNRLCDSFYLIWKEDTGNDWELGKQYVVMSYMILLSRFFNNSTGMITDIIAAGEEAFWNRLWDEVQ